MRRAVSPTAITALGITASAAPAIAIATRMATVAPVAVTLLAAITARLTRFARRARILEFLAGFLVTHAHRQAALAALVDLEHLDLPFHAFRPDIAQPFHPPNGRAPCRERVFP